MVYQNLYFYRKEAWRRIDTIASFIGISGIVFMSYDEFTNTSNVIGFILALSAALLQAGVNITIYDIKDESTAVISLYSMIFCVILSTPGIIYEQYNTIKKIEFKYSSIRKLLELSLTGILSFIAQCFRTYSIQLSNGLGIIVLRNITMLFTLFWDIILLHSKFHYMNIIGLVLILFSCIINKIL